MTISKRVFALSLLGTASLSAWAQFSLPGLGSVGKSSGNGDPARVEADLKSIIGTTSVAVSKLAESLGLSETAAKAKKTAEDIKSGQVGLADSTSIVTQTSASVTAEMEKNQKDGKKLDAASRAVAAEALLPAIKAFPLWKSVVDGVKLLDRGALMSAATLLDGSALMSTVTLISAATKVPLAAKSTLDMSHAAIAYLSFSGADTTVVKQAAEDSLKF